jgi:hypothetical protein
VVVAVIEVGEVVFVAARMRAEAEVSAQIEGEGEVVAIVGASRIVGEAEDLIVAVGGAEEGEEGLHPGNKEGESTFS